MDMAALPSDLSKVDPADAWKPWVPNAEEKWGHKQAAHLFRRAGFGATPEEIERAIADGFPKTLQTITTGQPDAAELLEVAIESGKLLKRNLSDLRAWWLWIMLQGGYPLREKMTLFWHNHFATSFGKVSANSVGEGTRLMYEQNVMLRKHALGNFRAFLLDMSKDTAMLIWLDSNQNVKGKPNENYAREVMELFSLGVGNYTEKDIQEAARAFTGWHAIQQADQNGESGKVAFEFSQVDHDDGEKTIFGKTGKWDGGDVVRFCCDHKACAKFLVGKLYNFLVSETKPPEALLEPLAAQFRKSDYDIASLVNTILGSRLFFSQHAYFKRVKWPVEYALEAARAVVPGRVPLADVVEPLGKMGQSLFAPPNVKGWRTGTDWLNSATLLARNNFAETVALGAWARTSASSRASYSVPVTRFVPPGSAPQPEPAESTSPPAPPPEQDPVVLIYAKKPKDIPTIVKRMGDLLNGEAPSPAVMAKIVKFLNQPGPPSNRQSGMLPPGGSHAYYPPATTVPAGGSTIPATDLPATPAKKAEPLAIAPAPRAVPPKPYKPDLDSDDFKARVREALHAMMCLPEYQLN
jgi:hypothetical protein